MITVGDLRKAIEGLPDDAVVVARAVGDILGYEPDEVVVELHEADRLAGAVSLKLQVTETFDEEEFEDEFWDYDDEDFDLDDDEEEDLD